MISNLAFLYPAKVAFHVRAYLIAAVTLGLVVFSSWFHACDWRDESCTFGFAVHRDLDYNFAFLLGPLIFLYLINFGKRWWWVEYALAAVYVVALALVTTMLPQQDNGSATFLVGGAVVGSAFLLWVVHVSCGKRRSLVYDTQTAMLGVVAFSQALVLFTIQDFVNSMRLYHYFHGTWHIAAAIGTAAFLSIYRKDPENPKSLLSKENGKYTTRSL